jgi:phosphatidate cytidylyltransferase
MHSSELERRIKSGLILGIIVIALTLWSPESFTIMCLVGSIILIREWWAITKPYRIFLLPFGILYISAAIISLLYIRTTNLNILIALLVIVWTGDIAAYFVGKKFGKHKIAPSISPGKSWEGLAASVIASAAVAAYLGSVAPIPHAILGAMLAVIGLGGDMFESSLKRRAGVKDSGRLIPGHGGLFDRVDALLPCAIFAAAALYMRLHMQ